MKKLGFYLSKANNIVRYYRVGPLGDVPSINGKLVEESLRHVMQNDGLGKVTTCGLIDLGIQRWNAGIQVKTYRKKSKVIVFCRSDKKNKTARIQDVFDRIAKNMQKLGLETLYLLDVDTFTSDHSVYKLAKLLKNGKLQTFGSFLKPQNVTVNLKQTHFLISKVGLKKA